MNPQILFLQIEIFFERLQHGEYDHPLMLAMALAAWGIRSSSDAGYGIGEFS